MFLKFDLHDGGKLAVDASKVSSVCANISNLKDKIVNIVVDGVQFSVLGEYGEIVELVGGKPEIRKRPAAADAQKYVGMTEEFEETCSGGGGGDSWSAYYAVPPEQTFGIFLSDNGKSTLVKQQVQKETNLPVAIRQEACEITEQDVQKLLQKAQEMQKEEKDLGPEKKVNFREFL